MPPSRSFNVGLQWMHLFPIIATLVLQNQLWHFRPWAYMYVRWRPYFPAIHVLLLLIIDCNKHNFKCNIFVTPSVPINWRQIYILFFRRPWGIEWPTTKLVFLFLTKMWENKIYIHLPPLIWSDLIVSRFGQRLPLVQLSSISSSIYIYLFR